MRIYDLARELNVSNKDVMAFLQSIGVAFKSHSSTIDDEAVRKTREAFPQKAGPPAPSAPPPPQKTVPQAGIPLKPGNLNVVQQAEQGTAQPAASVLAEPSDVAAPLAEPFRDRTPTSDAPAKSEKNGGAKMQAPCLSETEKIAKEKASPQHVPKSVPKPAPPVETKVAAKRTILFKGPIVVRDLAERLGLKPNQLIAELMMMNVFAAINERLEIKTVQQIAEKHGFIIEHEKKVAEARPLPELPREEEEIDRPEDLEARPPVVTFLGHIDHGKTSLLDRIRHTAVAKGEAGGITQHIGAYTVEHRGKKITFLDTPGHAAFTAMRARGANLTDIAVIIIAADDGVMPQTEEAIKHAQAAKTTIMVAINKMDLPGANPDRVKKQLQAIGLTPEEWGGEIICVEVSALTGKNMDHLLEMILLQAEMMELKANPRAKARGYVIEAQMEPGMGPIANLLVMRGALSVGDAIICGPYWGRVKALINDHGIKVRKATPGVPVRCMGLSGVPKPGEAFQYIADDSLARELAEQRLNDMHDAQIVAPKKASLETIFSKMAEDQRLELRLILKCDTQGSLEAILKMLDEIKSEKVSVSIILAAVGNVTENDVMLASASNAIIFGFNVSKEAGVAAAEKKEGVETRLYGIIYDILDQIKEAMSGMLKPEMKEKYVGRAEVRQVFAIAKRDRVAGCLTVNGRIKASCKARVKRGGDVLYEGAVSSLKRFQDQVGEVREGQECGIQLDNFNDFEPGDLIEFFEIEKIPQKL